MSASTSARKSPATAASPIRSHAARSQLTSTGRRASSASRPAVSYTRRAL